MDKVIIKLNTARYQAPDTDDVNEAKAYIVKRNEYALALASLIDRILSEVAERIMRICYQYNMEGEAFALDRDTALFGQIQAIMDEAQEEIGDLIEAYSVKCTDNEVYRKLLAIYLSSLGRRNRTFDHTLHEYLRRFLYDLEAMAASYRMSGYGITEALTRMKASLHNVYGQPEVRMAYRAPTVAAMYLQTKGVHYDFETGEATVGISNNGATNVTSMARNALTMVWMRYQAMMFKEDGAAGYYQLRGSNYPCALCDSEVGFHEGIDGIINDPYPHPHCMCYRIPIYNNKNY